MFYKITSKVLFLHKNLNKNIYVTTKNGIVTENVHVLVINIHQCRSKGLVAIICSNFFSNCQVDHVKTVAYSTLYPFIKYNMANIPILIHTVYKLHYCDQDRCVSKTVNLEKVDSTMFRDKTNAHRLLQAMSALPNNM